MKCQQHNKKMVKQTGCLHPIPVESKLWHQVGMDLIGPLPTTPRGNKYIVTLTDYFSKWPEAAALPNKSAEQVAYFMHSVSCNLLKKLLFAVLYNLLLWQKSIIWVPKLWYSFYTLWFNGIWTPE